MANIFDTLLQSKRPQALETISKAKEEREAFVKKLQETLSESLSNLIDTMYKDFPATCTSVKVEILSWWAHSISDISDLCGFGMHYSVHTTDTKDYEFDNQPVLLIPFSIFDSEHVYFGQETEYDMDNTLRNTNGYAYQTHEHNSADLVFYFPEHKEFQFISLKEIFSGEVMTEFVVDLTKEDSNNTAADNISEN